MPLAPTEGSPRRAGRAPARPRAEAAARDELGDPERHGTDVALAAFREAFAPGDDVTFVVRDYGASQPGLAAAVARLAADGYDARYWPAFYPAHRLGTFLSAFDVLVAPFRGEGFGIKLLDAMACGLPVVAPRFGGPADFLDDDAAYVVPHRLEPVRAGADASLLALGNRPLWAETAPADVAARLRECRDDPAELARRGEAARRCGDALLVGAHRASDRGERRAEAAVSRVAVVIPTWNGRELLDARAGLARAAVAAGRGGHRRRQRLAPTGPRRMCGSAGRRSRSSCWRGTAGSPPPSTPGWPRRRPSTSRC